MGDSNSLTLEVVKTGLRTVGLHPFTKQHTFLQLVITNKGIGDIEILSEYRHLMYLDISHNRLEELSVLKNLTTLVQLDASNNNIKKCVDFFPPLCNSDSAFSSGHHAIGSMLTLLNLSSNQITSLSHTLMEHRFLEILILANNKIEKIKNINYLQYLKVLDLSNNSIEKIENLKNLDNLRELNLANNKITTLTGIDVLPFLTSLNVESNQISSLYPLQNCEKLTFLNVKNNKVGVIRQIEHLQNLKSLEAISLEGNTCCLKAHYRLRVTFRLKTVKRLDDTNISPEEKIRAANLYGADSGDLAMRVKTFEQFVPGENFVDYNSEKLEYDDELSLTAEDLKGNGELYFVDDEVQVQVQVQVEKKENIEENEAANEEKHSETDEKEKAAVSFTELEEAQDYVVIDLDNLNQEDNLL